MRALPAICRPGLGSLAKRPGRRPGLPAGRAGATAVGRTGKGNNPVEPRDVSP